MMQNQRRMVGVGTFVRWISLSALSASAIAAPRDPGLGFGVVSVPETVTVSTSTTQLTPSTNVAYLITFNNNGGSAVQSTLVFGQLNATVGLTGAAILDGTANPALPTQCTVTEHDLQLRLRSR